MNPSGDENIFSSISLPGFGFVFGISIISDELEALLKCFPKLKFGFYNGKVLIPILKVNYGKVYICFSLSPFSFVKNFPGHRPYIKKANANHLQFKSSDFRNANVLFKQALVETFAPIHEKSYILIAPEIKGTVSGTNKQWPLEYYDELALRLKHDNCTVIEVNSSGKPLLKNTKFIPTENLSKLLNLIKNASLVVSNEGGVHHMAGVLGVPAIVIFGSYISPTITGYDSHINIFFPHDNKINGCGSLKKCIGCEETMKDISPNFIYRKVKALTKMFISGGEN